MIKKSLLNIVLGIGVSVVIMAGIFYFFLFPNPLGIYQANLLRWIPILACFAALFVSGLINRDTPVKLLPVLFLPFIIFDLFKFFYFPFVAVLFVVGILTLVLTRPHVDRRYKSGAAFAVTGIFLYFLLVQPLIIEHEGFGRNTEGDMVGATVIWDFTEKAPPTLPHHILVDMQQADFDIASLKGKTHFVSFWATWCAPCIEKKPQLDRLKRDYPTVGFVDISIDEERNQWAAFLAEHTPAGTQLITTDADETRRELGISALPLHFVVDPEGVYTAFNSLDDAEQMFRNIIAP